MKSMDFFLYWLILSCSKLSLNKPVYQQPLPDVHVMINFLRMSKGILRGDVTVCCTVYFQSFYPTCLLQQNKPLIILCLRNDSQFVSFWLTADVTTAGTGKMKFTIINLRCCQGTHVLNINDYHGTHILLRTWQSLCWSRNCTPFISLRSNWTVTYRRQSHILDVFFNSMNQYSHSSFTNRCTFIKTLITIYIEIRWLQQVSVYDHHQGVCNSAWLKLYRY